MKKEDLAVEMLDGVLTIAGDRTQEKEETERRSATWSVRLAGSSAVRAVGRGRAAEDPGDVFKSNAGTPVAFSLLNWWMSTTIRQRAGFTEPPMVLLDEPTDLDALRVRNEFLEMPGLSITIFQAARLFGLRHQRAADMLDALEHEGFLTRDGSGSYRRTRCDV